VIVVNKKGWVGISEIVSDRYLVKQIDKVEVFVMNNCGRTKSLHPNIGRLTISPSSMKALISRNTVKKVQSCSVVYCSLVGADTRGI